MPRRRSTSQPDAAPAPAPTQPLLIRSQGITVPDDVAAAFDRATARGGANTMLFGNALPRCNHIPTGSFILDLALMGGFPQAFPTMVYGKESTGKSTLLLKGVAQYQIKKPDKWVGLIDSEGLYDPAWAEMLGVDTARLVVTQPETGEEAVDLFADWLRVGSLGLLVLDSIPGCVPHEILDKSAEDATMTALPRLMGKMCQKWTGDGNAEKKKGHFLTFWASNQFREKVGFMQKGYYLPGGRQINHIPTTKIRLHLAKSEKGRDSMDMEVVQYDEQEFTLEKTKHGSSLKSGAFQLVLNPDNPRHLPMGSYDNSHQLVTYAKKMGFVTGGGASWHLHSLNGGALEGTRFQNLVSIEDMLDGDPVETDTLWRSLLVHQRKMKRLSPLPPDGYLVSPHGRLVELV